MGGGGGGVGGIVKRVVGAHTGTGSDSGALGVGQFRGSGYGIDAGAFRPNDDEIGFMRALQAQMRGEGPSAAQLQMRQGADLAANNAFALAASQRGANPAMGARLAQRAAQEAAQNANQQAGILRAQEQLNSQGMLGNLLQSQRDARIAQQQLGVQQQAGINQVNQAGYEGGANRRQNFMQNLGQGMSAMASMSDERAKTNVRGGDGSIKGFLDAIHAHKYAYKDKGMGPGEYVSPMAQELEQTDLGKDMVVETPQGKMVDYAKGFGAILAAQAHLNKRLENIEGEKMAFGGFVNPMNWGARTTRTVNEYRPNWVSSAQQAQNRGQMQAMNWSPPTRNADLMAGQQLGEKNMAEGGLVMSEELLPEEITESQAPTALMPAAPQGSITVPVSPQTQSLEAPMLNPSAVNLTANASAIDGINNSFKPTITPLKEKKDDDKSGEMMKMAGMALMAMSDKNAKTKVKDGDESIRGFLHAMGEKMARGGVVQDGSRAIDAVIGSYRPVVTGLKEPKPYKTSSKPKEDMGREKQFDMFSRGEHLASKGGKIPGRAKVKGDSEVNDTVPVRLSPGELVIPRTVVQDGPDAIKRFALAIMKKEKGNGKAS